MNLARGVALTALSAALVSACQRDAVTPQPAAPRATPPAPEEPVPEDNPAAPADLSGAAAWTRSRPLGRGAC